MNEVVLSEAVDSPFLIHLISFETLHYHLLNSVFREFSLKAALLRPIHHCAVFDFYFDYFLKGQQSFP